MTTTRRRAGRRSNGEGSPRKRSDGRWEWRVTLDNGDRRSIYGKTERETRDKAKALQRADEEGIVVTEPGLTVAAFLKDWRATVVPSKRGKHGEPLTAKTLENYDWALALIVPAIGRYRLRDLQPEHVDRMLAALAKEGYARNCVVRVRTVLTSALDHAHARRKLPWNVAKQSVMPVTETPRKGRALTPDEFRRVLAAAAEDRLGAFIVLGLATGARPGELIGLEWSALDLDAGAVTVRQAMVRVGNRQALGQMKAATNPMRTIGLPSWAVTALRAHKARQAVERLAAGPAWSTEWPDLVFTSMVGTPVLPGQLNKRNLRRITERAGAGKLNPYDLRHSAASLLVDAGRTVEEVADVLGNSPGTVWRHYRHRVRAVADAAVAPMEALAAGS